MHHYLNDYIGVSAGPADLANAGQKFQQLLSAATIALTSHMLHSAQSTPISCDYNHVMTTFSPCGFNIMMAEQEIMDDARIVSNTEVPHLPRKYHFPDCPFGNKGERRSFKAVWFDTWPWLNYQEDSVIWFHCSQASNRNLLVKGLYGRRKEAFITKGFINWKDACASFRKHETSKFYTYKLCRPLQNHNTMLMRCFHRCTVCCVYFAY